MDGDWGLEMDEMIKGMRGLFWRLLHPGSELKQGREKSWENHP